MRDRRVNTELINSGCQAGINYYEEFIPQGISLYETLNYFVATSNLNGEYVAQNYLGWYIKKEWAYKDEGLWIDFHLWMKQFNGYEGLSYHVNSAIGAFAVDFWKEYQKTDEFKDNMARIDDFKKMGVSYIELL